MKSKYRWYVLSKWNKGKRKVMSSGSGSDSKVQRMNAHAALSRLPISPDDVAATRHTSGQWRFGVLKA